MDGVALYREIARRWLERLGRIVFVTGDTLSMGLRDFAASGTGLARLKETRRRARARRDHRRHAYRAAVKK
jgi:hypothetical protein